MNKLKYFVAFALVIATIGTFSIDAVAQRGSRGGGGGGNGRGSGGGGGDFGGGSRVNNAGIGEYHGSGNQRNFGVGNASQAGRQSINRGSIFTPNNGGNGGLRPAAYTPRNYGGNNRIYNTVVYNNRGGYSGYNKNRGYYGGGYGYNYFPSYRYRPIYYSPFTYAHFGPAFGFRLSILPFGYYPFYLGNNPYYYYDGIYYRSYSDGGYEVTQPPLGATVKRLPSGVKATVINGQKYYELGGTFYQEQINDKNKIVYVVVGTDGVVNTADNSIQQGEEEAHLSNAVPTPNQSQSPSESSNLSQLPSNTKVVMLNQQKYYMAPNGVYYQEIIDANNNVSYQVVSNNINNTNPVNN